MRNDPIVEDMRAPFGLLGTDLEFQRARTLYAEAGTLADGSRLAEVLVDLEAEIEADFSREAGTASLTFEVWADMRYEGQSFDLPVTAPAGLAPAALVESLVERFEAEHESTYGHRARNERVVIVAIRLIGRGASASDDFAAGVRGTGRAA